MGLTQVQRWTALAAAVLDGVTTQQRAVIPMHLRGWLSLVWTWTSTLVANVTLEISDNYNADPYGNDDVGRAAAAAAARWTTVTDPAITNYLTTAPVAVPPGGKPSGVAGNAGIQIDPLRCAAVRITFDRTGSSGALTLDCEAG